MTSHISRTIQISIIATMLGPSISFGQSPSNPIETLKFCVLAHLPEEKQKSKPKFKSIKNKCQDEYDALFEVVHPKTANAYKKLIRDDIEKELKKK